MQFLVRLLAYPVSILYYLFFGLILIFFEFIQRLCMLLGYKAHKKSVDFLNFLILRGLNLVGTRFEFNIPFKLQKGESYIVVADHQSTYDIPPLIWFLRKIHPKFVGKESLGKGIPSISYNLNNGGAVLINRENPKQAIERIKAFGANLVSSKHSAVIFPEGTRSNCNKPGAFHYSGLIQLMKVMPNAKLMGVSISHSWKLLKHGPFPLALELRW